MAADFANVGPPYFFGRRPGHNNNMRDVDVKRYNFLQEHFVLVSCPTEFLVRELAATPGRPFHRPLPPDPFLGPPPLPHHNGDWGAIYNYMQRTREPAAVRFIGALVYVRHVTAHVSLFGVFGFTDALRDHLKRAYYTLHWLLYHIFNVDARGLKRYGANNQAVTHYNYVTGPVQFREGGYAPNGRYLGPCNPQGYLQFSDRRGAIACPRARRVAMIMYRVMRNYKQYRSNIYPSKLNLTKSFE